jgi:hypothetical protein
VATALDDPFAVGDDGHVAGHGEASAAALLHRPRRLLQAVLAATADHDVRSGLCEPEGERDPESGRAAGDQRDLVLQH